MRGIQTFVIGLLVISAVVLFAGILLEPITEVVLASSAVQEMGWDSAAVDIQNTILRWIPLMFIGYLLTWAVMWAIRRERTTGMRR